MCKDVECRLRFGSVLRRLLVLAFRPFSLHSPFPYSVLLCFFVFLCTFTGLSVSSKDRATFRQLVHVAMEVYRRLPAESALLQSCLRCGQLGTSPMRAFRKRWPSITCCCSKHLGSPCSTSMQTGSPAAVKTSSCSIVARPQSSSSFFLVIPVSSDSAYEQNEEYIQAENNKGVEEPCSSRKCFTRRTAT